MRINCVRMLLFETTILSLSFVADLWNLANKTVEEKHFLNECTPPLSIGLLLIHSRICFLEPTDIYIVPRATTRDTRANHGKRIKESWTFLVISLSLPLFFFLLINTDVCSITRVIKYKSLKCLHFSCWQIKKKHTLVSNRINTAWKIEINYFYFIISSETLQTFGSSRDFLCCSTIRKNEF